MVRPSISTHRLRTHPVPIPAAHHPSRPQRVLHIRHTSNRIPAPPAGPPLRATPSYPALKFNYPKAIGSARPLSRIAETLTFSRPSVTPPLQTPCGTSETVVPRPSKTGLSRIARALIEADASRRPAVQGQDPQGTGTPERDCEVEWDVRLGASSMDSSSNTTKTSNASDDSNTTTNTLTTIRRLIAAANTVIETKRADFACDKREAWKKCCSSVMDPYDRKTAPTARLFQELKVKKEKLRKDAEKVQELEEFVGRMGVSGQRDGEMEDVEGKIEGVRRVVKGGGM